MMLTSGTLLFAVLLFQFLQGKRIIKFKGARHRKVHMVVAWVLLAMAALHGLIGYAFWLTVRAS
jgi:hypothetical protein